MITFFFCVESGPLEVQACRLASSIRQFGGQFKDAEILAIRPRKGPPLRKGTIETFRNLGVRYFYSPQKAGFDWFSFMNKPKAFVTANRLASADTLVWLDTDTLVLQEPNALVLSGDEQFSACPTEKNIGSSGPEDPHDNFWQRLSIELSCDIEKLPWMTTEEDECRIRGYWNSGVVVFKRDCGLAEAYLEANQQILEKILYPEASGLFYTDQIALAVAYLKSEVKYRPLPFTHNLTMRPEIPHKDPQIIEQAKIVHYRGSMWPETWPDFVDSFRAPHDDVHQWLVDLGPLYNPSPLPWRGVQKIQGVARGLRKKRLEKRGKI